LINRISPPSDINLDGENMKCGVTKYFALRALRNFEGGLREDAKRIIQQELERVGLIRKEESINGILHRMKEEGLVDPIYRLTDKGRALLEILPNRISSLSIARANQRGKIVWVRTDIEEIE
jgi:hypothetical protein